jgi:predicted RNase H-like nuclease (RuvC/YqgF family)
MAHDNDADGFLGTIDIHHGAPKNKDEDKAVKQENTSAQTSADDLNEPQDGETAATNHDSTEKPHVKTDDSEIAELEKKITELEAEMAEALDAEHTLIEKISHLEKELSGGKTASKQYLHIAEEG